ncbi:MAG: hypothetical protein ACK523_03190, partial [Pirellulaceae bacterium]
TRKKYFDQHRTSDILFRVSCPLWMDRHHSAFESAYRSFIFDSSLRDTRWNLPGATTHWTISSGRKSPHRALALMKFVYGFDRRSSFRTPGKTGVTLGTGSGGKMSK